MVPQAGKNVVPTRTHLIRGRRSTMRARDMPFVSAIAGVKCALLLGWGITIVARFRRGVVNGGLRLFHGGGVNGGLLLGGGSNGGLRLFHGEGVNRGLLLGGGGNGGLRLFHGGGINDGLLLGGGNKHA